ncbi:hypothetical protein ACQRBF_06490 [Peptoniphilaceae bacterium SGI.131]
MRTLKYLLLKDMGLYGFNIFASLRDRKRRSKLLVALVAIVVLAVYSILFTKVFLGSFDTFKSLGMADSFLMAGYFVYLILLLFMSGTIIISKIYFSNDITTLLPLPIKSQTLMISNVAISSIMGIVYSLFYTVPVILKYGSGMNQGIEYYIFAFISLVTMTVITNSLVAFVIVLVMSYVNKFASAKKILQFFGMLLTIVFSLGINFMIQKFMTENGGFNQNMFINATNGLVEQMYSIFPPLRIVNLSLTSPTITEKIFYLLLQIVLTIAIVFISANVGSKLMIKGILLNKVVAVKKKKEKSIKLGQKSTFASLISKEFNTIFRNPAYAFNTLGVGLILPLALMIPFLAKNDMGNINFSEIKMYLDMFIEETVGEIPIYFASGLLLSLFFTATACAATTSITREGNRIWLMQSLPIKAKEQISARIVSSMILSFLTVLPTFLLIAFFLKFGIKFFLVAMVANLVASFFISSVGLFVDILRPKLDWRTPQEAMKQNLNVFILTIINFMIIGGLIYLGLKLISFENNSFIYYTAAVSAILLVLSFVINLLSVKNLDSKLRKY